MDSIVLLGRCLSDPIAVRILVLLLEGPRSTARLRSDLGLSRSVLDVRLAKLQRANLIDAGSRLRSHPVTLSTRSVSIVRSLIEKFEEEIQWDEDLTVAMRTAT